MAGFIQAITNKTPQKLETKPVGFRRLHARLQESDLGSLYTFTSIQEHLKTRIDSTTKYYVRDWTGKEEKEAELGAFLDKSDSWLVHKNWKVVSNLTYARFI